MKDIKDSREVGLQDKGKPFKCMMHLLCSVGHRRHLPQTFQELDLPPSKIHLVFKPLKLCELAPAKRWVNPKSQQLLNFFSLYNYQNPQIEIQPFFGDHATLKFFLKTMKFGVRHTWVQMSPVPLLAVGLCSKHPPGAQLHPLPSEDCNYFIGL